MVVVHVVRKTQSPYSDDFYTTSQLVASIVAFASSLLN